ncbi:v-SNARE [Verticillium alfalfae VaMs.102]|uniref:V-SNARE n=1 Tax=Verticillium alfalfae (strain VaMs.102 / ATCC MYA-4576 / FGSC 10136) TaxID=526221 RepID=C9SEF2_VERA1|nr:v-SNARE [Verticillium alfalfae VaMs.102]EEY16545.1 v-SNARE [Verticillium alfalfae VaMs.102]
MAPPAEISIPSTILSTGESKPFTLYNITLRLPLRSFVVQKRYSDFASLHSSLTTHVGSPPPAPLPQKSWFKSTVSSPELTENRRRGLEHYLRTIAESPDRRWRDTPAWRAFLNLPSGGSARRLGHLVRRLTDGLKAMQEGGRLGDGELRRRRDLLSSAKVEREGLDKLSNSFGSAQVGHQGQGGGGGGREGIARAGGGTKAALLGGGGVAGQRTGGRRASARRCPRQRGTRELDNEGVLQLQKQMMGEQDQQVEGPRRHHPPSKRRWACRSTRRLRRRPTCSTA